MATADADAIATTGIRAAGALTEELRRRLYGFTRTARRPVTREEAAAAVGISRKLAAFHLDKLVEVGLLRYRFSAVGAGRVGRRPKVYESADTDIQVSIPARRHEILAAILIQALLTEQQHESAKAAAAQAAHERGMTAAVAVRDRVRPGRLGAERALTLAEEIVSSYGFEPDRVAPGCIRLRNCPFHPIAQQAPELVCQLNHAFMVGLTDGLQAHTVDAVLTPVAGECCVELRASTPQ
jgi:predicted ArsR family transcriptional regulator